MTDTTITLTEREAALLTASLNYTDREGQLSDNYSNLDLAGAARICGGKHEAAGVIGSLVKKGLALPPEVYSDEDETIWLTEEGVHAIFDHLEAR